jgi:hypothetical protein
MTSKDSAHDVSKEFAQAEGAEPWALGLCAVVCLFFGGHDDIPGRASREEVPSLTRLVIRVHGFDRFRNGLVIVDFPEMETIPIMYVYIYICIGCKQNPNYSSSNRGFEHSRGLDRFPSDVEGVHQYQKPPRYLE